MVHPAVFQQGKALLCLKTQRGKGLLARLFPKQLCIQSSQILIPGVIYKTTREKISLLTCCCRAPTPSGYRCQCECRYPPAIRRFLIVITEPYARSVRSKQRTMNYLKKSCHDFSNLEASCSKTSPLGRRQSVAITRTEIILGLPRWFNMNTVVSRKA